MNFSNECYLKEKLEVVNIKNKKYIKLLIMLIVSMLIISICSAIQAKYIFQYKFDIANLNIDRTKPQIELLSIENSKQEDKEYVNKSDIVTIKIKITDKNLKDVFLNKDYLKIKIKDVNVDSAKIKSDKIEDIADGGIYQIELTNLKGNGILKVNILEGTVVDTGGLKNEVFEVNTGVLVDNNIISSNNNVDSNFVIFTYE